MLTLFGFCRLLKLFSLKSVDWLPPATSTKKHSCSLETGELLYEFRF